MPLKSLSEAKRIIETLGNELEKRDATIKKLRAKNEALSNAKREAMQIFEWILDTDNDSCFTPAIIPWLDKFYDHRNTRKTR